MATPTLRSNPPWNALPVRTPHDAGPPLRNSVSDTSNRALLTGFVGDGRTRFVTVLHGIASLLDDVDPSLVDQYASLLLCLQGALATAMAVAHTKHLGMVHVQSRVSLAMFTAACAISISLLPALLALINPAIRSTRIVLGVAQAFMLALLIAIPTCAVENHWHAARAIMTVLLLVDWGAIVAATAVHVFVRKTETPNYFPASLSHQPERRREKILATRLRKAITEGGLSLAYQPIFAGDRMVAVEALARWTDPVEGVISPAEFIPVAEDTGLIVPFTDWVLREACTQMVRWTAIRPHPERIAVNVSVKHIWRGDFVATVERILAETGLAPHRLELEVTESSLVADFNTVKCHLSALRALGIRISIDDFGTGYSSLNRVRELDADTLKVDRLFVQAATESPNGLAMVQAIIDMAHSLKLSVVAEGVETQEQVRMLRSMHCDEMQGYLLARPQTAEALTKLLLSAAPTVLFQSETQHSHLYV